MLRIHHWQQFRLISHGCNFHNAAIDRLYIYIWHTSEDKYHNLKRNKNKHNTDIVTLRLNANNA